VTGLSSVGGEGGGVGSIGPQGPQGETGPEGPQGPQGLQGPAGLDGAQGATGLQGPAGLDGAQGATGLQGPAGLDGAQGATGPQGPAGLDGAQGPQGPQGLQGPAGTGSGDAYFMIWGEESNASLTVGGYDWSLGNGSDDETWSFNGGIVIPFACEIISMAISNNMKSTYEIAPTINGTAQEAGRVGVNNQESNYLDIVSPIQLAKGDIFNFKTMSVTLDTSQAKRVMATIRKV